MKDSNFLLEVYFNLDDGTSYEVLTLEGYTLQDIFCVLGQNMFWYSDDRIDYIIYHCGDVVLCK